MADANAHFPQILKIPLRINQNTPFQAEKFNFDFFSDQAAYPFPHTPLQ